jgi:hypothetical protein
VYNIALQSASDVSGAYSTVIQRCAVGIIIKNAVFWDVPPKGRFLQNPHCGTSQKTAFFTIAAAKT